MMRRRLFDWLTTEHWVIGAGLMRVSLGAWAVYFYLLQWPFRGYLWGPDSAFPFEKFLELSDMPSVFQFSVAPAYFEAVYVIAIAIAILVVVGFLPRVTILLHSVMIWSFQERNPFLGDGGDNIMRIVLLFLTLTNTGAYFSVHASNRPARSALRTVFQPALAVVHNFGVLLIIAQLCLMYMSTGLYKAMGELWQNGTALYYILRVDEFSLPGVAELIYRNVYLVVFGTYATVLFEVMFVPSLLNRWTRYITIAVGSLFHLGIAFVMGLLTFGWSMLSIYPLLLTDEEYQGAAAWVRDRFRLLVLYDADCAFCTLTIRVMDAANLFSLVEYLPYQQPEVLARYEIPLAKAERRMQSITAGSKVTEGMASLVLICGRSPGLWPLFPFVWIGRLIFGHRLYDWVAARRRSLMAERCTLPADLAEKGG